MLSLAEFVAYAAQLKTLADFYDRTVEQNILEGASKTEAIRIGKDLYGNYYKEYRTLLDKTLRSVAENAYDYHIGKLNVTEALKKNEVIEKVIAQQYKRAYYGATLEARLKFNAIRLERNIIKSAQIDPLHVSKALTVPFPFGAQYQIDKRLMLSQSVKVEQDIMRAVAKDNDIKLVKWNLSHRHAKPDFCDDLATNVDKSAVKYIEENNLKVSPKGVYLIDDVPPPPHPNCQCEQELVSRETVGERTPVQRALHKVISLIRKLTGKH